MSNPGLKKKNTISNINNFTNSQNNIYVERKREKDIHLSYYVVLLCFYVFFFFFVKLFFVTEFLNLYKLIELFNKKTVY